MTQDPKKQLVSRFGYNPTIANQIDKSLINSGDDDDDEDSEESTDYDESTDSDEYTDTDETVSDSERDDLLRSLCTNANGEVDFEKYEKYLQADEFRRNR